MTPYKTEIIHNNTIPEKGKWYLVAREPDYWKERHGVYPIFGRVGYCKWVRHDYAGAYLSFVDGEDERMVLFYCLEEASEEDIVHAKVLREERKKMTTKSTNLNKDNLKLTSRYRITQVPHFWTKSGAEVDTYESLGKVGRIKNVYEHGVILNLDSKPEDFKNNHFIPYDCLELVMERPPVLEGDLLLQKMRQNPEGMLHLLRGLGKMTKNPILRLFTETGRFPETF
jgi:hypothetical protein